MSNATGISPHSLCAYDPPWYTRSNLGLSFSIPSGAVYAAALPYCLSPGAERDFRVLLSGIGGDEFTGGVPTGIPELADLIREGRFAALLQSSFQWSLASRKPLLQTLQRTVRAFLPTLRASRSRSQWPMPW